MSDQGIAPHYMQLRRKCRGRSPMSGRPIYGWDSGCSCGWKQHSNEKKANAERLWKRHVKEFTK